MKKAPNERDRRPRRKPIRKRRKRRRSVKQRRKRRRTKRNVKRPRRSRKPERTRKKRKIPTSSSDSRSGPKRLRMPSCGKKYETRLRRSWRTSPVMTRPRRKKIFQILSTTTLASEQAAVVVYRSTFVARRLLSKRRFSALTRNQAPAELKRSETLRRQWGPSAATRKIMSDQASDPKKTVLAVKRVRREKPVLRKHPQLSCQNLPRPARNFSRELTEWSFKPRAKIK